MNNMKKKHEQARELVKNFLVLPETDRATVADMIKSVAALERFKSQRSQKTA